MKDFFRSQNKPMLIASLAFVAFGFLFTVNPNIIREVAISYVIAGALFMYALISVIIYIKTPVGNGFGLVFGLVARGFPSVSERLSLWALSAWLSASA